MLSRYSVLLAIASLHFLTSADLLLAQPTTGRLVFTKQGPEATAEHLVNDRKFGGSSAKFAIEYSDQIIPLIKSESDNFKQLDNRNSFWIAEVLGKIDSELARQTLKELYGRKELLPRFVGAIGLAMHGIDIGPINDESFLVKFAKKEGPRGDDEIRFNDGTEQELAIIALGYSKSEDALPVLHEALSIKAYRHGVHVEACRAIARIKSPKSIPILQICLKDTENHLSHYVYRAAICLGDKEATPIAIEALGADEHRSSSEQKLILELRRVTGKKWWFGLYKKTWQKWWESEGEKWAIPEEFLADWDKQPPPR